VGAERLTAALAALSAGALLGACGGSSGRDGDAASPELLDAEPAVVARVTDGDTLRLRDGRRVRLLQIDAPEKGECFARAATRMLARRVPRGTRVRLARDRTLDNRDEHGRLLRYVLLANLVDVNVELVRDGAAVPYFFRGERGLLADELLDAARDAQAARRGLWRACPRATLDPEAGFSTGSA
jgi:micrococcal nuclease